MLKRLLRWHYNLVARLCFCSRCDHLKTRHFHKRLPKETDCKNACLDCFILSQEILKTKIREMNEEITQDLANIGNTMQEADHPAQ